MDISSNNQLVPYNQGTRPVTPYSPRESGSVPAEGYPAAKQYVLMPSPHSPGYKIQAGDQASIYTSNRQIKAQKNNMIGLLIDFYA